MPIDVERRRKVMARSRRLGHCVCEPSKPCPCPSLIECNLCPCAGERPEPAAGGGATRLTQLVRRAGCASKIGQGDLMRLLSGLPPVTDPNVLVGMASGDDAGVYRLGNGQALVQTVDVFAPVVDDAFLFGRIAAANSLSDVYAMGGRPLTALSIVGFPIEEHDGALLAAMLAGGMETLAEAGCALLGGHSINDVEIKLGFAVTGLIDERRVIERGRVQPGDALVLTKPLGTGMVAFGVQIGRLAPRCLAEAGEWMARLNRDAAELMGEFGAHACTDVTGFGLAGHLVEMARGSGVSVELDLARLPVHAAVPECLAREIISGAIERNQAYAMAWIDAAQADPALVPLIYDPQTSGGLLVALPEMAAAGYVEALRARGHDAAAIIGRAVKQTGGESVITVWGAAFETLFGDTTGMVLDQEQPTAAIAGGSAPGNGHHAAEAPCCATPPGEAAEAEAQSDAQGADSAEPGGAAALTLFKQFMAEANRPGLIDAEHKKLIAIALSIAQRCEPCLRSHLASAAKMGIAQAKIDEAANLAISFGGCSAMVFYKDVCASVRERAKG